MVAKQMMHHCLSDTQIDFYHEKFVVKPQFLVAYLCWELQRTFGVFAKCRKLFSMTLFWRASKGTVRLVASSLLSLAEESSWAKYESDGNCLQVYCLKKLTVIKVLRQPNPSRLQTEVKYRKQLGASCPAILAQDFDNGILSESFMTLFPTVYDLAVLRRAIYILRSKLYQVETTSLSDYLARLLSKIDQNYHLKYFDLRGVCDVPISPVHGDVWFGNLFYDPEGRLIIIDWEYARPCVVTHDIWCYLFQKYRGDRMAFDNSFFSTFSDMVLESLDLNFDIALARDYHLIHLLERYCFFREMVSCSKEQELTYLRVQIDKFAECRS
jgi:hypothetical protein